MKKRKQVDLYPVICGEEYDEMKRTIWFTYSMTRNGESSSAGVITGVSAKCSPGIAQVMSRNLGL